MESGRSTSLGVKLALATVAVLSLVSVFLFQQLTSRERDHLVSSKRRAANMVSDLFAASLAAPLDFGDPDALEVELSNLRTNAEIIDAWVWSGSSPAPIARLRREANTEPAAHPEADGIRILDDRVEVTRGVFGRQGKPLGQAVVVFSLAAENAAFQANRRRILWSTLAMDAITALILILIARHQIVAPLAKVAEGARRLEKGELGARADVVSNDEIGQLARAFNAMGEAIADREQRLSAARKSLRDLFDHMRQAIFAFGSDGKVVGEVSRQAIRLFGRESLDGIDVRELLYPVEKLSVDAQAFDEWIGAAFAVRESDWNEFASLAPTEVWIPTAAGDPIPLELEFRPVARNGKIHRVMLLATDVSEKRNLERQVQSREEDHARQMAAMRRLLAGGPQVFVSFVDGARQRIKRCLEIVGPSIRNLPSAEIDELFRHVHTIKGEAKALDMRDLESESAKLEEELDELRARARGDGFATTGSVHSSLLQNFQSASKALDRGCDVFVAASPTGRAALDQMTVQRSDVLELVKLVGDQQDALGQIASRLASRPLGEATANLIDLVPTWAEREGKRARLEVDNREIRIAPALARVLGGVLTHLVRNAIVHGIEIPAERENAGKDVGGVIRVSAEEGKVGPVITIEDDGQGMDTALLAERAVAIGQDGNGPPVAGLELAFLPGLSTAARPGDLAGRGVGLYAVRAELSSVGYSVELSSRRGAFTKFVLRPEGAASQSRILLKDAHG